MNYVTVDQLLKEHPENAKHRKEYERLARLPDVMCENCSMNPRWKFANTGMCFTCTTGEAKDDDDYELMP